MTGEGGVDYGFLIYAIVIAASAVVGRIGCRRLINRRRGHEYTLTQRKATGALTPCRGIVGRRFRKRSVVARGQAMAPVTHDEL